MVIVDRRDHNTFDRLARPIDDLAANRFGVNLLAERKKCQSESGE
jgi:hypothetical protein